MVTYLEDRPERHRERGTTIRDAILMILTRRNTCRFTIGNRARDIHLNGKAHRGFSNATKGIP